MLRKHRTSQAFACACARDHSKYGGEFASHAQISCARPWSVAGRTRKKNFLRTQNTTMLRGQKTATRFGRTDRREAISTPGQKSGKLRTRNHTGDGQHRLRFFSPSATMIADRSRASATATWCRGEAKSARDAEIGVEWQGMGSMRFDASGTAGREGPRRMTTETAPRRRGRRQTLVRVLRGEAGGRSAQNPWRHRGGVPPGRPTPHTNA